MSNAFIVGNMFEKAQFRYKEGQKLLYIQVGKVLIELDDNDRIELKSFLIRLTRDLDKKAEKKKGV